MTTLALFAVLFIGATLAQSQQSSAKDCNAPRDRGNKCNEAQARQMFSYDKNKDICQPLMYNGCGGNGNRFDTVDECRDTCTGGKAQLMREQGQTLSPQEQMKTACSADYDTDHLTPITCSQQKRCPTGNDCKGGFCCPTAQTVCLMTYDSGKFAVNGAKSDKYFFIPKYNTCMRFSFYGTLGNANNFKDYPSCMRMCGSVLSQQ